MLNSLLGRRLKWVTRGGWIADIPKHLPPSPHQERIEAVAAANNENLGPQHVAAEYDLPDAKFTVRDVSSPPMQGDLYAWLVANRRPEIIIEFGSGFGVSGMYFAAGLEDNQRGHLYSFEINDEWAAVAERAIATMSDRFTLTRGSFEDNVDVVAGPIDIALVDGIHTYDFVMKQWEILQPRMAKGGIVLFDDISYGQGMREAWLEIARSKGVAGAVEFQNRLGLLECP